MTMNKNTFVKSLFISSVALAASLSQSVFASPIVVPDSPNIAAKGYVLMDYNSGKVLAQKEMNTKFLPASLTKMMTSYVIGQEIARGNISNDDEVTISKDAWAKNFPESSKMFLERCEGQLTYLYTLYRWKHHVVNNGALRAIVQH